MSVPRFDRTDWTTMASMGAVVLALHVFGWGVLVFGVAPQHITLGSAGVFGIGLGVTAYLLGVRHAFDADHIAVIDNTTRKLVGEGKRSLSAGFWFSLGHSSVVFALAFLLAIGVRALVGPAFLVDRVEVHQERAQRRHGFCRIAVRLDDQRIGKGVEQGFGRGHVGRRFEDPLRAPA